MAGAVVLGLLLMSVLRLAEAGHPEPAISPTACAGLASLARSGDLVFRAEAGAISRWVMRAQGDDRYSHVGVVVVSGGHPSVFHAEIDAEAGSNGVVSQDVCEYLRRAVRASLMRPTNLDEAARGAVADAVASVGYRPFNWRLLWQPPDGSVYCTQYVWQVFERALPGRLPRLSTDAVLTIPRLLDSMSLTTLRSLRPLPHVQDSR